MSLCKKILPITLIAILIFALMPTVAGTSYAGSTKVKITFNSQGGSTISAKTIESGSTIGKLKTPTNKGLSFKGWYTKPSSGKKVSSNTKVSKNVTYYAQWKIGKAYVLATFKAYDYCIYKAYKKNAELGAAANKKVTRSGYKFKGWYTKPSGGSVISKKTKIVKNTIYYAVWEKTTQSSPTSPDNTDTPAANSVKIDSANFPDEGFRIFVGAILDKDNNGELSANEIKSTTYIDARPASIKLIGGTTIYLSYIKSLKGIENFTELTELNIDRQEVESLDLSANKKLSILHCANNNIKQLNLSSNQKLERLYCNKNPLERLDISANKELERLDASSCGLASLNLSANTALLSLDCGSNELTGIDLSKCANLKNLGCNSNKIEGINLSANAKLEVLFCDFNELKDLNVSSNPALDTLSCRSNHIVDPDLSKNVKLRYLDCRNNEISELNLYSNSALRAFDCSSNASSLKVILKTGYICNALYAPMVFGVDFGLQTVNEYTGGTYAGYNDPAWIERRE